MQKQKRQKRVVLFTGPGCVWCTKAKNFFKKNKIKFREIDITKDKQAAADCKKHCGGGIPVILIENRWISGFNEPLIKKELGLK
ncbi:MAG: glutaredoxin family protein [Epsilonproteobacteria bacterium]|nr:glutaredoxin family protein [Campylobacterota bacterium]